MISIQFETLLDVVVFVAKCFLVAGLVYAIFSLVHYLDRKFTELIPYFPKFVIYVLVVILVLIWAFAKLLSFKVIDA
ncbi:MAG: hypothetical protein KTR22_05135 [Flavobacteriaceae bacterium]|nr:hypothetical protein [Flavobacteriaceae bacterium]